MLKERRHQIIDLALDGPPLAAVKAAEAHALVLEHPELLSNRKRQQKSNYFGSIASRYEATVRLHVVAGHYLIWVRDEAIKLCFIPDEVRALHSTGIAVVRQRTGFPADNFV